MRSVIQDAKMAPVPGRPIQSETKRYEYSRDVKKRIAARAYQTFERRGKAHGHDLDDWLDAEAQIVWELH